MTLKTVYVKCNLNGDQAQSAQLYILDGSMEPTERIGKMNMPNNISPDDQNTLKNLLMTVQGVIHQCNSFIKDFIQILELTDEELCGGKVLISTAAKPREELIKGEIFGLPVAHLWVIEFQKRGLPHAHILLILADDKRPRTPEDVD